MSKGLISQLERYRREHKLTYDALSQKLKVPGNYIFRWRKAGRIVGVYKRLIEEFLSKNGNKAYK